ncbi:MAG: BLUF domain-containing protein [Ferruginibacter sp.]
MHTLTYLSAASNLFSNDDLVDILTKSRLNNTRLGITGLLLYHEGSILQILEGEKEDMYTLFNKIKNDARHKGVIKMFDRSIEQRSFPDWSMGFKQVSNEDWSSLHGYLNLDDINELNPITDSQSTLIVSMIKSFANVNRLDI